MAKRKMQDILEEKDKSEKTIRIRIKLDKGAIMPEYAHEGDAALDLFANETLILLPHHRVPVKTGTYIELPKGHVGLIKDKSGLALKYGLHTLGGVMDSGYRGEYLVVLINLSSKAFRIKKGSKIAQLLIQKIENAEIEQVDELGETDRGSGNFGSTGSRQRKPEKSNLQDIKKALE